MDIHMSPPSCGRVFKGNIWGRAAGYMTFFWLVGGEVTGWNSRNANHQPSGSNQSGVSACTDCYHLLPGWWPCCCQVASVVSNSVQPHRRQPTRLRHHWDSPGKNTGVGCHFLLQGYKLKATKWRNAYTEFWGGSRSLWEILRIWKLTPRNWEQRLVKFMIIEERK